MAVKIKQIAPDRYSINGKLAHQDMEGNWIGNPEMTTEEVSAFQKHLAIQNQQDDATRSLRSQA